MLWLSMIFVTASSDSVFIIQVDSIEVKIYIYILLVFGIHTMSRYNYQKVGGTEWRRGTESSSFSTEVQCYILDTAPAGSNLIWAYNLYQRWGMYSTIDRLRPVIFQMSFFISLMVSGFRGPERHFCRVHPKPSSPRSHLLCSMTLMLSADNV